MSEELKKELTGYKKELERLLLTHLDGTYKHDGDVCNCPIGILLTQLISMVDSNPLMKGRSAGNE